MFSLRRNQIIIAALVLMICVAGYLNHLDTRNNADEEHYSMFGMTSDGELGAIVLDGLVGNQVIATIGDNEATEPADRTPDRDTEPGTAVFVSATTESPFFVQARLSREQDRSRQKETLTTLMNSPDADAATRALSGEAIVELTRRIEKEGAAETALMARGFGESYVRINDNWVEVIINRPVITDQELAQLEEVVTRHTQASVSQIRLSSVRQ